MVTCSRCDAELAENWRVCPFCGRPINYTPNKKKRGNGQGTAFKRGRTWYAQVTDYIYVDDEGKMHRKYKTKGGFATKREALAYCDTLRGNTVKEMPTVLDLYLLWEKTELPKLSKDKQTGYKKARKRLESIIGRKIDSLSTADLQKVIDDNSSSYYTAKDMKTVLSHIYNRACADRFVPSNLTQYIVLPELNEREQTPFTSEEVAKMWNAYADGDTFIGYLLLMIYSGMMPAELFECRKDMIDLDRCEIYGCGKKTRKGTTIVFADIVKPVVAELIAASHNGKLCPIYRTEWYDAYHEATKRIGIRDLPPYSCRHTTGTEAAKQNLNASTIQKIMRHAKITTSQKYIHLGTDEAHAGINVLPKSTTNG